jgi:hypothetical protein
MGLFGSTDGGSSAGIGNFKRIFNHRKGRKKLVRHTLKKNFHLGVDKARWACMED